MISTLLLINAVQFFIGLIVLVTQGRTITEKVYLYAYLTLGLMLFSSLITIFGLYLAIRYKNDNMMETIQNLEELNTRLRMQRHDYLNHFQVIYGLMELEEYEEAKRYIDPVFKDIMKVSKALKTAQPAINALLQAKLEAAEKKQIDLFLEIRSDLKNIPIEPWNLCKVLANIIDNGMIALAEKEKDRSIYIEIGEDIPSYHLCISNNGPQIPKSLLENIFKQGYTTKKEEEHGMGLYIVDKLIKEVGGRVRVESCPEKTSFYIELPKGDCNLEAKK